MSDFYKTGMGRKFYEHDFPSMVKQLERIANVLGENKMTCPRCGVRVNEVELLPGKETYHCPKCKMKITLEDALGG